MNRYLEKKKGIYFTEDLKEIKYTLLGEGYTKIGKTLAKRILKEVLYFF